MLEDIAPFFIVSNLANSLSFYRDRLGCDVAFAAPDDEPFFAIVARDRLRIFLKEIAPDVAPKPNAKEHEWAPWDAFVTTADPDALATEFGTQAEDRDDGLRGFEMRDPDGYVLFFGRPRHE